MKALKSIFADRLSDYVKLRRGLGLKFEHQAAILGAFDSSLHKQSYGGQLTQKLALDFAGDNTDGTVTECARRYQVVRHFSEYLATFDPDTPRLDPKALRRPRTRPPPYIYTEEELARLLHEALHISRRSPIRGISLHAMVGLAASTGLRIGEVDAPRQVARRP